MNWLEIVNIAMSNYSTYDLPNGVTLIKNQQETRNLRETWILTRSKGFGLEILVEQNSAMDAIDAGIKKGWFE